MAESKIPVGSTGKDLRTVEQTTAAGTVHTEALFIADPDDVAQKAKVTNTAPAADASGVVVRSAGITEVADADLILTIPNAVTVGSASSTIVAADSSDERDVLISVPTTADTGIHVNVGAAATTSKFLIQAGGSLTLNTNQEVHAIRAGSVDVTAYLITGVPA